MSLLNDSASSVTRGQATHQAPYLWIQVQQLELDCIIGIYEQERHTPQKLIVDLALALSPEDWLKSGQQGLLDRSINYADVAEQVSQLICAAEFRLLESIFPLLAHLYLSPSCQQPTQAQAQALKLSLHKLHALSPTASPSPCLSMSISRSEWLQLNNSASGSIVRSSSQNSSQSCSQKLSERSQSKVKASPILILPEVHIYQLDSEHSLDRLELTPDESLVLLNSSASAQNPDAFKAIYVQRRALS